MNNFDMSSIIKDMTSMKQQMKILQNVQETSLSVHAALCKKNTLSKRERKKIDVRQPLSPVVNIRATPTRTKNDVTTESSNELQEISADTTTRPATESEETNEMTPESDDSDLLLLASIQRDDNMSYSTVVRQSERSRNSSRRQYDVLNIRHEILNVPS